MRTIVLIICAILSSPSWALQLTEKGHLDLDNPMDIKMYGWVGFARIDDEQQNKIAILDFSNPAQPEVMSTIDITENAPESRVLTFYRWKNSLLVGYEHQDNLFQGLMIYDIHSLRDPVWSNNKTMRHGVTAISEFRDTILLGDKGSRLIGVSISDTDIVHDVFTLQLPFHFEGERFPVQTLDVVAPRVYVGYSNRLTEVELSLIYDPGVRGEVEVPSAGFIPDHINASAVIGKNVYMAHKGGFSTIDVTTPSSNALIDTLSGMAAGSGFAGLTMNGKWGLTVKTGAAEPLTLLDFSNPLQPTSFATANHEFTSINWVGDMLYTTDEEGVRAWEIEL